jgi:hypothetical protein
MPKLRLLENKLVMGVLGIQTSVILELRTKFNFPPIPVWVVDAESQACKAVCTKRLFFFVELYPR